MESPRSLHRDALPQDWTTDQKAATIEAFLQNRPEGATDEEIERWLVFIGGVTLDAALIEGVEAGRQKAQWNGLEWVFSNVDP